MKKMKRLARAAMTLTLAGSLLCTAALAEEVDPYVYELEGFYSMSTHRVGWSTDEDATEADATSYRASTFELIDTTLEAGQASGEEQPAGEQPAGESEGSQPEMGSKENPFAAYCCDIETDVEFGSLYRMLNLEDSTYFDDETAENIRGILGNGFLADWTADDLAAAQKAANDWLTAQDGEGAAIAGMTYAEALSATQAAIWHYANPEYSIFPYTKTTGRGADSDECYDQQEGNNAACPLDVNEAATENTRNNIESFYNYLINQQRKKPSTALFSDNEFISSEAVFTEDSLAYNVTVRVKLSGTVGDKDELTLKASLGGQEKTFNLTGEGALVPDENGYYTITFSGLSAAAGDEELTASLSLSGSQQVDDVYFFQAKPVKEDEDSERASSQNLVGYAQGRAIVTASGEITGIKLGTADASLDKYDGSAESTTEQTGTNNVLGTDGNYYPSLSGVTFDLYAKDNDGVYHLVKKGLVSDANGNVYVKGLSEGYDYFFRETGTNAGYILTDGYVAAGTSLANYRDGSVIIAETVTMGNLGSGFFKKNNNNDEKKQSEAGGEDETALDGDTPRVGVPSTGADSDTALYLLVTGACAAAFAAVLLKKRRNA